MSTTLYFDRRDLTVQLRDIVSRIPALPAKVAVALLAGAGSVSVVALALSSPAIPTGAPAAQMAAIPAVIQNEPLRSCKEQTWPYVDRNCQQTNADGGSHPPRAVRVISTDRVAPATLNASPVVLAARPEATSEATIGSAPQTAPLDNSSASAQPDEIVPMPKPRPVQTVATRQTDPTNLRRALALHPPIRAEDDDGVQVRAYALPNGRRVTVYSYGNVSERAVISRNDIYERRSFRSPFASLFD
jgi:hypothetical protein